MGACPMDGGNAAFTTSARGPAAAAFGATAGAAGAGAAAEDGAGGAAPLAQPTSVATAASSAVRRSGLTFISTLLDVSRLTDYDQVDANPGRRRVSTGRGTGTSGPRGVRVATPVAVIASSRGASVCPAASGAR